MGSQRVQAESESSMAPAHKRLGSEVQVGGSIMDLEVRAEGTCMGANAGVGGGGGGKWQN